MYARLVSCSKKIVRLCFGPHNHDARVGAPEADVKCAAARRGARLVGPVGRIHSAALSNVREKKPEIFSIYKFKTSRAKRKIGGTGRENAPTKRAVTCWNWRDVPMTLRTKCTRQSIRGAEVKIKQTAKTRNFSLGSSSIDLSHGGECETANRNRIWKMSIINRSF